MKDKQQKLRKTPHSKDPELYLGFVLRGRGGLLKFTEPPNEKAIRICINHIQTHEILAVNMQ